MLYLVSYDLKRPEKDYPALFAALSQLGAEKVLLSEWFVISDAAPDVIVNSLTAAGGFDGNDRVLVTELRQNAAWNNTLLSTARVQEWYAHARP